MSSSKYPFKRADFTSKWRMIHCFAQAVAITIRTTTISATGAYVSHKSMSGLWRFPNRKGRANNRSNVPSYFLLTFRTSLDGKHFAPREGSTISHVPSSRRGSSSSAIAISHRSLLGEARADLRDGESDPDVSRIWQVCTAIGMRTSGSWVEWHLRVSAGNALHSFGDLRAREEDRGCKEGYSELDCTSSTPLPSAPISISGSASNPSEPMLSSCSLSTAPSWSSSKSGMSMAF
jgi:hypothetical protein